MMFPTPRRRRTSAGSTRWAAAVIVGLIASSVPGWAVAQSTADGAALFSRLDCSRCHGDRAQGDFGPQLAATELSVELVTAQLRSPRGPMPTYGTDRLSDEEIVAIYGWLQELPDEAHFPTWFSTELINLQTPETPGEKTLEVHFSHRFSESIRDAGRQGLWGLDSFAVPSFTFMYGIVDRVAAYGGRSSNRGTWEYGAKVALLEEGTTSVPVSAAAVVGGAYVDRDDVPDKNRFTLEVPVGVRVHERLSLMATPLLATNTDPTGNPASDDYSAAIGIGGSFRFTPGQSVDVEWVTNVGGFEQPDAIAQWQVYWGIKVGGHVFQIGLTNSILHTADQMSAGAVEMGTKSEVRLGFNLVRAFKFGGGP